MGYGSQSGKVAIRTQATRGVPMTDIETAGVALKLRSGSLAGNRELLIPDPEIGGGRDISDALLGPVSYSGDYEMYTRFSGIGTLLRAALGEVNTVTTTGVSVHTFTGSDDAQLPFLTVYEEISSGLERAQYTDAVCNTFHLEVEPNGFLMGTCGLIAVKQLLGVPALDLSAVYDDTTLTVGTNVTVKYDGVNVKAKAFSLDVNNNFEDDDFRLGQFTLEDLTPKRREVTASITLRHEDNLMMRQALNGASTAVAPGGLTTKKELEIQIDTYQEIPGATPTTTKYSMNIKLHKALFEPFAFAPSGDDILENDITLQAVRPTLGTSIMTAVLTNGTPALA
jgi:hypothetical protein